MPVTNYHTLNGELLGETGPGGRRFYGKDALGSVVATYDQNGTLENTYRYKPYGGLLSKTGSAPDPRFMWTGSTGSRTTGASYAEQYNRARHYGSRQAGWTSVDPLWPTEAAYLYVRGNPVRWVDSSGLSSCSEPRNNTCRFVAIPDVCCVPTIRCISAYASFQMRLHTEPNSEFIRDGVLSVTYGYVVRYMPMGNTPCPPDHPFIGRVTFQATSGLDGFQYHAGEQTPAGWCINDHGPIPPSTAVTGGWTISTTCHAPTSALRDAMTLGNESFRFMIAPEKTPIRGCTGVTRKYFRLHPDGGGEGSAGCIVFQSEGLSRSFRSCMYWLNTYGCDNIPLTVNYT